jgi:hypothetical protein
MTWVLLLMKMDSISPKLSMTVNRVRNKVVGFSNEITDGKATML